MLPVPLPDTRRVIDITRRTDSLASPGAKILMELWTEVTPTGAYWNPTRVVSDNRIPAFGSDTSVYTFAAPTDDMLAVRVTLLFRRAFKTLMDQKGWDSPDILMAQEMLRVP